MLTPKRQAAGDVQPDLVEDFPGFIAGFVFGLKYGISTEIIL
ncbi:MULTISPECIES: hypothetical protein [Micrococcaceae]|nr:MULTISPECIES: hypothetical protein [Micrococcaceae]AOY74089.1 hypothetical protein ARZXY2_4590 [Arthrobacter sp. ZXY-2]